jgi:peptide-methionine (S)-S-oxide reductase
MPPNGRWNLGNAMKTTQRIAIAAAAAACIWAGAHITRQDTNPMNESPPSPPVDPANVERVSFGAGCFWCVEAVFQRMKGVISVTSGYQGGETANPTYREICSGTTGHAEVIQVEYDKTTASFDDLLDLFWQSHDPSTLNRQGPDRGTQYRSAIFYTTEAQREAAEKSKRAADASGAFSHPIVTEITAAPTFYPAEDYHQDYYNNNRNAPYCAFNIKPKLKKLGME